MKPSGIRNHVVSPYHGMTVQASIGNNAQKAKGLIGIAMATIPIAKTTLPTVATDQDA